MTSGGSWGHSLTLALGWGVQGAPGRRPGPVWGPREPPDPSKPEWGTSGLPGPRSRRGSPPPTHILQGLPELEAEPRL